MSNARRDDDATARNETDRDEGEGEGENEEFLPGFASLEDYSKVLRILTSAKTTCAWLCINSSSRCLMLHWIVA